MSLFQQELHELKDCLVASKEFENLKVDRKIAAQTSENSMINTWSQTKRVCGMHKSVHVTESILN